MNSRELREKRAKAVADAQALIPKTGEKWTPDNRSKFDAFMAEADTLKTQIDDLEREGRAAEASQQLQQTQRPPEGQVDASGATDPQRAEREEKHKRAFRSYLLRGANDMAPEDRAILQEFRDMGTGGGNALQGTGGGYFVPVGFVNKVEEAMKWYGDMLNVATILPTATGQPLPYPTDNDTSTTGELVGENSSVTTGDVSLGNVVFNAYKFSTKMVKVSLELLQDSAFDIESFLQNKFAIRLGRILNTKFTVGDGDEEPNGIISAATASGITVVGDDNATSPDPTKEIGWLDLIALEHSVDRAYRRGAKYMWHDTTLRFLKQRKDKYGRPLWLPGIAVNAPDTVNGYGYSINNDMEELAAGKKTAAFGLLEKYMIRRVKELLVLRLTERFADYGQVAFLGFARYDGDLLDAGTHPVKYLVQHS